jgi:hypothetical protein
MNKIKGYCTQEEEPTPDNPVEIEVRTIGKNLFETYESFKVNEKYYSSNIGNTLIAIPKEQYCEYEQLKQKVDKQKEVLDKIKEYCKNTINRYEDYIGKEDIVRENKFILELLEEII